MMKERANQTCSSDIQVVLIQMSNVSFFVLIQVETELIKLHSQETYPSKLDDKMPSAEQKGHQRLIQELGN